MQVKTLVAVLQGIIINGCIRDSADIEKMPLGVKALATYPLKSSKRDPGLQNVAVTFGGVVFRPGEWLYAGTLTPLCQAVNLPHHLLRPESIQCSFLTTGISVTPVLLLLECCSHLLAGSPDCSSHLVVCCDHCHRHSAHACI